MKQQTSDFAHRSGAAHGVIVMKRGALGDFPHLTESEQIRTNWHILKPHTHS